MASRPLEGTRVLDFTWVMAGPVSTRILAALGAEVIKIERQPEIYLASQMGIANDINRDKLSMSINMASPQGIELAQRLVRITDLVRDNFSARVMRQWKMDYENLVKIKPDIICLSMSGFGHTGPHSNYVSFGPTLQALTGFSLMMADQQGRPAGFSYSYSDSAGGYTGALAAMFALWHRKRTGQGQFVDFSQFEGLTSLIGPDLLDMSINHRQPQPHKWSSQEGPAAPHGVYKCRPRGQDADRWIVISVSTQEQWRRFTAAIGNPPWVSDLRFRTLYSRMRHNRELDEFIGRWAAEQEAEAAMSLLQDAHVAAGLVENIEDAALRDPQFAVRGYWPAVTMPDGTKNQVSGMPYKLSMTPPAVLNGAHAVGADANYVLGELLGIGRAEQEQLVKDKVIWVY
jgi:crotonobetainyl-CoA:carnitine CoA-transferase CaiB-like acyl-CoA transferase